MLDYLGGPSVTTKVVKRDSTESESEREGDVTKEVEGERAM